MNSEELEQSLRTEFETYVNKVVSKMRDDTAEFRQKMEAELDAQRSQFDEQRARFDESIRDFSARCEGEHQFEAGFSETVGEHLRLARDEGSQIAANAIAEAEKLRQEELPPPPSADYGKINDAIKEISAQQSQSTILKSLVKYAADYAGRGAFFIVKNDHFVGWKTLGTDSENDFARDIKIPISSSSLLGRAVNSLSISEGSYDPDSEDRSFLEQLRFGQPDKMYAIPLTARGRGVAVMYVDRGAKGREPDLGALESLVRVAGMTVELQASAQPVPAPQPAAAEPISTPQDFSSYPTYDSPSLETKVPAKAELAAADFSSSKNSTDVETVSSTSFNRAQEDFDPRGFDTYTPERAVNEKPSWKPQQPFDVGTSSFDDQESIPVSFEPAPIRVTEYHPEPFNVPVTPSFSDVAVAAPVAAEASRARLNNRYVDLPIDVAEDERRLHNDARRFARLLVSEIKLYNEQKVKEGRESSDLYERLREAIDRSREMYEKRVQPPVAAKFDYFNYELVHTLADGELTRLGGSYPGPSI